MDKGKSLVRTFFAIDLAEEAKKNAIKIIKTLNEKNMYSGVRWMREESLHITLCFLGNISVEKISHLIENVRQSVKGIIPFTITFNAVTAFPDDQHPHTLAMIPQPEEALITLGKAIKEGVNKSGLKTELRPFRPHLTLGRIKFNQEFTENFQAVSKVVMNVSEFVLFQSLGDSRYVVVGRVIL